jgi:hypothetical protein
MSKINGLDKHIRELITEMNNHESFITTSSCAGHYKICPQFKANFKFDDSELENYVDYIQNNSKYCTGISQPYIYFKLKFMNDNIISFINALKDSDRSFPYSFTISNDTYQYSYGNGDEGYDQKLDHWKIIPQFKEFWIHFITLWKTYINLKSEINPICKFPLIRCNYFCHDKIHIKRQNKKENIFSFLNPELFGDEWFDMINLHSDPIIQNK